ncbi:MAG: hypothetical protein A2020_15875 [Lentisphaerae bacterium GWF2_45_14]|nr:MAG: hypothetical protein A2020_15875 [Lentisphaerae bacterium GWF2_45_14]
MNRPALNNSEKKSRSSVLLCGLIVTPSAVLFAYASDLPHILVVTLLILITSLIVPKSVRYSDRSIIYAALTALALAAGGDLVVKMDPQRMGLISGLLQANISAPFLIYLAAMSAFFRSGPESRGACISMALAANLLSGEIISYKFINKNMTFFISEIREYPQTFFALILGFQIIFTLWALNISRPRLQKSERPFTITKSLVTAAALIIMPFICWGGFKLYMRYENNLKQYELYFLRMGMKKKDAGARVTFDKNVNLNIPLPDNMQEKFDTIILRAAALKPPGYLRGRAYTHYDAGEWSEPDEEKSEPLSVDHKSGALSFSTFYISEKQQKAEYAVSIYPCGNSIGNIIPVPGSSSEVDIISEKLSISPDGTLIPESWQRDGGYTCKTSSYSQDSACENPSNPFYPKYLETPDSLKDETGRILEKAIKKRDKSKLKDSEAIAILTDYLLKNYEYSLKQENSRKSDPVSHFLSKTKKGHCELFASSLVMLLREYGIPARYVTGIICDEAHPSGRYYAARLGNAHAWVEAYPRDLNRWILAEPTPPSGIPAGQNKWGTFDRWTDLISQIWQKMFADMRRGYFAQAIIGTVSGIFGLLFDFMSGPPRAFASILIISSLVFFFVKRKHKGKKVPRVHPHTSMVIKDFRKFEKEITRISRIRRKTTVPLGEWASLQPSGLGAHEAVEKYYALRFSQSPPELADVTDFHKYIQKNITKMKKIKSL